MARRSAASPGLRAYDKPKVKAAPEPERPAPVTTLKGLGWPLCPETLDNGDPCTIRVRDGGPCSPHRALAEAADHPYESDPEHRAEPQWRRCRVCGHSQQPHPDKGNYVPKALPGGPVRAPGRQQQPSRPTTATTPLQRWRIEAWGALRELAEAGEPFGVADLLEKVGGDVGTFDAAEGLILSARADGRLVQQGDQWVGK